MFIRLRNIATSILLGACIAANAQSISNAETQYNEFVRIISTSGESISAYDALYLSYEQYWGVLNSNNQIEYAQARNGLKTILPYLNNGAYFYTGIKNNKRATEFVEAYVSITMHEQMQNESLQIGDDYATFAWMAATNSYNSKKYDKAIIYLQAYINSGESKRRAEAYNYMAKSYIHLNDYTHAQFILEQGLTLYPDNLSMLTSIINLLGEQKSDDTALQRYVTQAFRYKPTDEGLINIQAQLYERNHKYEEALMMYNKLYQMKPRSLEVARHLAINSYNAGVVYAQQASAGGKESKECKKTAGEFFTLAVKQLNDVLYSDPLAINYAYALANAYAYIGDDINLQKINSKLQQLGYEPATISDSANMEVMAYTNESSKPNLTAPIQRPIAQNQPQSQPSQQRTVNNMNRPLPVMAAKSDVDVNIPVNATDNLNTYAIIIANEKYQKVAEVPNAENDGNVFAEYCNKVLGIPSEHIRKHLNVTFGDMIDAIEDMKSIAAAASMRGECNIIFYYAGHGVPDEKTKTAHMLPVDADGRQMRVCYPLSTLYSELENMNTNCTTVFLDACFSGATRNESEMLMSARSVAIAVDEEEVDGNIVIFSAATDDQTALSYDDKNHGMFTYYLLKKLQETKGDVNLYDLSNYVTSEVALQARLKNHKDQTPTIASGLTMGDRWKKIKLKD